MIAMADRAAITIWAIIALTVLGAIALLCASGATDAEKVKGFEKEIVLWKTRYEETERLHREELGRLHRERSAEQSAARRAEEAKGWEQRRQRDLGEMP